jgi:hypothetical protein
LRFFELNCDPAGLDLHAAGKLVHLLAHYPDGSFDQNLRPFQAIPPELIEKFGYFAAAGAFVKDILTSCETAEMANQSVTVGQTTGADMVRDTGAHDLLGAAASNAEKDFDGGAIDERAGKRLKLPDNSIEMAVPDGFGRHGVFSMLVRMCA